MSDFTCIGCSNVAHIMSVEVITEAFPCHPDGEGGIKYDGSGGDIWHSKREHYMCLHCNHIYHDEDALLACKVHEEVSK